MNSSGSLALTAKAVICLLVVCVLFELGLLLVLTIKGFGDVNEAAFQQNERIRLIEEQLDRLGRRLKALEHEASPKPSGMLRYRDHLGFAQFVPAAGWRASRP